MVLGLLIYYFVYTAKINKRIRSGEVSGKKLVDIPRVIMFFVIAVLGFYCIVLWHYLHNADGTSRNDYVVISVEGQDEDEYYVYGGNQGLMDASFAGVYSKESNAGYNKKVIKEGDYIFTIFKRISSKADNFHPDFLCYAEYKGKNKESMTVYNTASFVSVSDVNDSWNSGHNGYGISDCLLFIGNLQVGVNFHIRFDLMDEAAEASFTDAKQKNPEEDNGNSPNPADFATSSAEVTISFN